MGVDADGEHDAVALQPSGRRSRTAPGSSPVAGVPSRRSRSGTADMSKCRDDVPPGEDVLRQRWPVVRRLVLGGQHDQVTGEPLAAQGPSPPRTRPARPRRSRSSPWRHPSGFTDSPVSELGPRRVSQVTRERLGGTRRADARAHRLPNVDSCVVNSDGADPLIGRLVDERYRVDEQVARGGMATVYRATDTRLDRTVALKVMHPSFAEDPDFVARFTREARAAARLSNPHIVKVFDQGQDGSVDLPGDGVRAEPHAARRPQRARTAARRARRWPSSTRCCRRWPPRTPRASSTATSSPRTC